MGICGQAANISDQNKGKPNKNLLIKNNILNRNNELLGNQLEKLKMEILKKSTDFFVDGDAINNINNNMNVLNSQQNNNCFLPNNNNNFPQFNNNIINLNNQNILQQTYNFCTPDLRNTQITVNEETTIGNVITKLCENWNIPYSNGLTLINKGIPKSCNTSDSTLFKNTFFEPNERILVMI